MIIVEGPDGAGKTTLVNSIVDAYGLRVGERGTADRDLLYTVTVPDTLNALTQAVRGEQSPKVWDRLYFSEAIYCSVVGRPNEFSMPLRTHIEALLAAMRIPVIFCLPPWETVKENAAKDKQMPGVMDNLRTIYDGYTALLHAFSRADYRPLLFHDYTGQRVGSVGTTQVLREVGRYIERRKERKP